MAMMRCFVRVLLLFGTTAAAYCPEGWEESKCLGSSGTLASSGPVAFKEDESIQWTAGLSGHSHYALEAAKTAVLIIDPQKAYAACPSNLTVEELIKSPSAEDFEGHSPLCCEKFDDVVKNQNAIAKKAREAGSPVFVVGHVYRDLDGDGAVDNCGRICDFDALGWAGWPKVWNLWNAALPWHELVLGGDAGFHADTTADYYVEKSVYSAMTAPVVDKLTELGVDTVVVTGFMTQYCSVTTSRHAHDLGFKVVYVQDANDGPILPQLLSGVDENAAVPLYLGIAVADVISTADLLASPAFAGTTATEEL